MLSLSVEESIVGSEVVTVLRGYGIIRIVCVAVQVTNDSDRSQHGERSSDPSSGMFSE